MNLAEPYDLVVSGSTAAVLRVLIGAETSFSIRKTARIAGISVPQAMRVLNHLSDRGLVLVEQAGRSRMCRFNKGHLASNAVVELITLRTRIIQAIGDEISTWALKPMHSSLFGSAARKDGGVESDLDVLIVRPGKVFENQWEEQKYVSGLNVREKTGNAVSWFDISLTELKSAKAAAEPIFLEWEREGITLTGPALLKLFNVSKKAAR